MEQEPSAVLEMPSTAPAAGLGSVRRQSQRLAQTQRTPTPPRSPPTAALVQGQGSLLQPGVKSDLAMAATPSKSVRTVDEASSGALQLPPSPRTPRPVVTTRLPVQSPSSSTPRSQMVTRARAKARNRLSLARSAEADVSGLPSHPAESPSTANLGVQISHTPRFQPRRAHASAENTPRALDHAGVALKSPTRRQEPSRLEEETPEALVAEPVESERPTVPDQERSPASEVRPRKLDSPSKLDSATSARFKKLFGSVEEDVLKIEAFGIKSVYDKNPQDVSRAWDDFTLIYGEAVNASISANEWRLFWELELRRRLEPLIRLSEEANKRLNASREDISTSKNGSDGTVHWISNSEPKLPSPQPALRLAGQDSEGGIIESNGSEHSNDSDNSDDDGEDSDASNQVFHSAPQDQQDRSEKRLGREDDDTDSLAQPQTHGKRNRRLDDTDLGYNDDAASLNKRQRLTFNATEPGDAEGMDTALSRVNPELPLPEGRGQTFRLYEDDEIILDTGVENVDPQSVAYLLPPPHHERQEWQRKGEDLSRPPQQVPAEQSEGRQMAQGEFGGPREDAGEGSVHCVEGNHSSLQSFEKGSPSARNPRKRFAIPPSPTISDTSEEHYRQMSVAQSEGIEDGVIGQGQMPRSGKLDVITEGDLPDDATSLGPEISSSLSSRRRNGQRLGQSKDARGPIDSAPEKSRFRVKGKAPQTGIDASAKKVCPRGESEVSEDAFDPPITAHTAFRHYRQGTAALFDEATQDPDLAMPLPNESDDDEDNETDDGARLIVEPIPIEHEALRTEDDGDDDDDDEIPPHDEHMPYADRGHRHSVPHAKTPGLNRSASPDRQEMFVPEGDLSDSRWRAATVQSATSVTQKRHQNRSRHGSAKIQVGEGTVESEQLKSHPAMSTELTSPAVNGLTSPSARVPSESGPARRTRTVPARSRLLGPGLGSFSTRVSKASTSRSPGDLWAEKASKLVGLPKPLGSTDRAHQAPRNPVKQSALRRLALASQRSESPDSSLVVPPARTQNRVSATSQNPSSTTQSRSVHVPGKAATGDQSQKRAAELEEFIDEHLEMNCTREQVLEALERCTYDSQIARQVLNYRSRGRFIPSDLAGYWRPEHDAVLLNSADANELKSLVRLHGQQKTDERREQLFGRGS